MFGWPLVWLAVIITLVAFALGQFPRDDPLVPPLHVTIPGISDAIDALERKEPGTRRLELPKVMQQGGVLTIGGRAEPVGGDVRIDIHWNARPWRTIYMAPLASDRRYEANVPLRKTGRLNVRVMLPNGDLVRGSTRVVP